MKAETGRGGGGGTVCVGGGSGGEAAAAEAEAPQQVAVQAHWHVLAAITVRVLKPHADLLCQLFCSVLACASHGTRIFAMHMLINTTHELSPKCR